MPKLWTETIEAHRREVHEAIQEKTTALVAEQGLHAVTMSQIAEATGIGRATLYKYYPDVPNILHAWHERQVRAHLQQLTELRERAPDAKHALEAVLEAYAFIRHQHAGHELAHLLHHGSHVAHAEQALKHLLTELIESAASSGSARRDIRPGELANYCMYALAAAGGLSSKAAVRRLVAVTLTGLRDG